ncbi:lipoprotein-releasing system permease protein [Moheibacter sediminis]|uniref:Lipoprotein-releasing system permease protein n=2 Tax=Moheibacter sediminis TaxID=1434700 RepID=A0A1W2ALV7_9FLAO|nr:lipoprotein-releasing system permease protein [Moheibacter sediminis]
MVLIVISAFLIGTFIYIGNVSTEIFQSLVFGNEPVTGINQFILYSLSTVYTILQTTIIYLIFNKLLKRVSKNSKLLIAFIISLISISGAGLVTYLNTSSSNLLSFLSLILLSTGLLSIIFAILSFVFAKRKITGVNIITSIAVFAITIATCALFIILSVFSGLEKMNIQFFSNVNPDLKISPAKGKTIPNLDEMIQKLESNPQIVAYSKVIEEKVSIEYEDKQDIAYIKGIDENYTNVVRIDTTVVGGSYLDFSTPNQILTSDGVARRLQMYTDLRYGAKLSMPKPGTGLITNADEAFNSAVATSVGVVFINDQYDKYIFSPIELTQNLLQLPKNSAYSLEIKAKPNTSLNSLKKTLQSNLGNSVVVQTRQDLDATFIKVMNVENLIIYLIFTLVSTIASFNLAGAIIIIIIDKKKQIKSMWSFGMPKEHIKRIFFQTGLLITVSSILFGLVLGSIIGILQQQFGLVMANPFVAFPFEFTVSNFLVVILTVLAIGGGVSYLVSRKLPS